MIFLSFTGIIAIVWAPMVLAYNLNEINIVNVDTLRINEKFLAKETYNAAVLKVNETYNRLTLKFDVIKDLPPDTKIINQIYGSKHGCGNWKKILDYTIAICNSNDRYHDHLTEEISKPSKMGKCMPAGHYDIPNYGDFKFYDLLSRRDRRNSCFKKIATTACTGEVILDLEFEFVSNYYK